jgi:hypothetical protein
LIAKNKVIRRFIMSKQLRVKVNGNPYEVEIKDFSGVIAEVSVNGTAYSIEIEEAGGTVVAAPVSKPAPVASAAPAKPAPTAAAPAVAIAAAGWGITSNFRRCTSVTDGLSCGGNCSGRKLWSDVYNPHTS